MSVSTRLMDWIRTRFFNWHRCIICETLQPVCESVTIGEHTYHVCEGCIADNSNRPGRYEGLCEYEVTIALLLEHLDGNGWSDYFLSDESGDYASVIDRFILTIDGPGFVGVQEFKDNESAMREINSWEDDGFGANEFDAFIYCGTRGYDVSFGGTFIGTYQTERRARAAVSLQMRKDDYYPNVFLTGEHGPTIRRIDVW